MTVDTGRRTLQGVIDPNNDAGRQDPVKVKSFLYSAEDLFCFCLLTYHRQSCRTDPFDTDIIRGASDCASPRTGGLPSAMRVNNRQGRKSSPRQTLFSVNRDASPIYDQEFEQSVDVSLTRSRSPHESVAISQIEE